MKRSQAKTGIVLTGGGSRGAYQAGVLQGIAEIAAKHQQELPFGIISGASAGAINGSFIAATADQFAAAAPQLAAFWGSLKSRSIFRTDVASLGRIGLHWATDLTLGSLKRGKSARALLDATPLRRLIGAGIHFDGIRRNLDSGHIMACEVSALDYATSENVSFIMSREAMAPWVHPRRRSQYTDIGVAHVMGSAAIPLLFAPMLADGRYYGDGCVRNPAPFSPAIRLGARRLLIVGVRHGRPPGAPRFEIAPGDVQPTVARILGVVINAVMMDTVEYDIDRLTKLNDLVEAVPEAYREHLPLKRIEFLAIQPSANLAALAAQEFRHLPSAIQYLIAGLGSPQEASELASYLLFEPSFCSLIAALGRQDAYHRRDEIEAFLFGP